MGTARCRWNRSSLGVVLSVVLVIGAGACSSSSSSAKLTAEQRAALGEVAAAFDEAEASVATAFEAAVVVPKLERWQQTEDRHQAALRALRDGLPAGECRSAVERLLVVEDGQNAVRGRLIEDYRAERYGLVAKDATDYGASVINGAYQAEDGVAVACGRSTVDAARTTTRAAALTPAQNALVDAVLAAYAETRVAFDAAFSVPEFVADVEVQQAAEAAVGAALDAMIALLAPGECRDSLQEIRTLERQQSELRTTIIAAGKAGDAVKMFTVLGDYSAINSTSETFTSARRAAVVNCGGDV